ncbi:ABC transporter ATP-binding protein [Rummeliibacillus sp. TYF005]|uniref:ABC transporter ATP-binding protein n=1 Tax=unclassified Rummeliibacillus TaxID=2622809 RepID=UPI000E664E48|nr:MULTISPECIES: ABC transporter ATP-binding protein [unclassified Rummeliibacillus]RIJ63356.1 ABC transporter ATP-binding protein [Rummeliibacillus sp. POC4]RPJ94703.1 ABC transporter ATP-binding protein [Rummeliibacillus sp. TYF005]
MGEVIKVNHLQKKFKSEYALQDVSFEIEKGEIFGFLGPSGSGKTTTIKILTGQLSPTNGDVKVFKQDISFLKSPEARQRLGILSDNSGLYDRLTIEENLDLYRKIYNLKENSVKKSLEFVNLYSDRKKHINKLSKGMRQRVLLARTILHQPDLLFLDEPTSALDPVNKFHIYEGLRRLNAEGTTVFLTTHDMAEADTLCNRIAFLNNGKICAIGTPKELKKQYADDTLTVELKNGQQETISKGATDANKMFDWMQKNLVERVSTNEPSLGEIFVQVTGRKLV